MYLFVVQPRGDYCGCSGSPRLNLVDLSVFPAFALAMGEGEQGVLDNRRIGSEGANPWWHSMDPVVLHGAMLSGATLAALGVAKILRFDQSATLDYNAPSPLPSLNFGARSTYAVGAQAF